MLHVSRHGDRGSELPALPTATVWRAGQEAEVTWQITANHGGGYQVTRDTCHTCLHTRVYTHVSSTGCAPRTSR